MFSDEFECVSYLNRSYGTWFVNINNELANELLKQAEDKCTQIENSLLYCIFCMGSECRTQPSEGMITYVKSCLDRLSIDKKIKESIVSILNNALGKSSDILCISE